MGQRLSFSIVALLCALSLSAQTRYDQGRADPEMRLPYVTLMLKPSPEQQQSLEQLLTAQQDPASTQYHRWLTPDQFGDRFGPSPAAYATVVSWLGSQALHVEDRAHSRLWIAFSGTARQMENAFHTEIHRYLIDGQSHFANSTDPQLPAALDKVVGGVRGLDDLGEASTRTDPRFTISSGVTQLAPYDWATIYDVKPLYAMGIDGTGQRVGIMGRSSITTSDMDKFRRSFFLPATIIEQHLIGPDPGVTNAATEAALDLEWAGAIAPNATLVYVYANNFNDAVQAAVDQNLASVISESFGVCELGNGPGNRILAQQANAQGITFVASAGDSGPAGCDAHGFFGSTAGTPASLGFAVEMPASYPEVTAIGGTQFNEGGGQYWNPINISNGGSALSYIPEVVWNQSGASALLAGPGGASIYFPKPAWQTGPGVPNDNARDVPDVSFSASGFPHDPYIIVHNGTQTSSGGTSAGAPSFAGVVALLNQYLVSKGVQAQPGLGNINPRLYFLARTTSNVFHDITGGNNIVSCTASSPGCVNGSMGFNAGPGYDLASGLGSIDIYNLVTQWNVPTASSSTALTVNPTSIALGDSVQLTATVNGASGVPTGSVTFSSGRTILGTSALINVQGVAMATLTVNGPQLHVGTANVVATYNGDSAFSGSTGSIGVNVAARSAGSAVMVSISPNPAHEGEFVKVTLTEEAGVGTTVTDWTINGNEDFQFFAQDFGSTTLAPYGSLSTTIGTVGTKFPATRLYMFSGVDADGRKWSQQFELTLVGPLGVPGVVLLSTPSTNPACQSSQQLLVWEQSGLEVQLTRLLAGSDDWTSHIQQLFGTTLLAPFGILQASVCPAGTNPSQLTFELDGIDQTGEPVTARFTSTSARPATNPNSLTVSKSSVTLAVANPAQTTTGRITVNLDGQAWSATVFPANQTTTWLKVSPPSGTGSQDIAITASGAGLTTGVYNAILLLTSATQLLEVPVAFEVGTGAPSMSIAGVSNGASFDVAFAPGMVLSVFGTSLAPSVAQASGLPLPLNLAGVSATVNGVPSPLYYVSSGQLNIQVPYETGSGPAVLGVNNNGQVASYVFTVAPSAPGIFTDSTSALVPFPSGRPGDVLTLFVTGEGLVTPPLATGASTFFATPLTLLPRPGLPVTITVGNIKADVIFAGIPPGLAGVTQINFVVPKGIAAGVQPVVVTVGGISSKAANLTVAP